MNHFFMECHTTVSILSDIQMNLTLITLHEIFSKKSLFSNTLLYWKIYNIVFEQLF